MRTLISYIPFLSYQPASLPWEGGGLWPARWVNYPSALQSPFVTAYRLRFSLPSSATIRAHVTADERYELFLDGKRIGRGPERGDQQHWYFETYDLPLDGGEHLLVARVWALGDLAPVAQLSYQPGFLFCPEDEMWWDLLATGRAPWEVKKLRGYSFTHPMAGFGIGHKLDIDGHQYDWDYERGEGQGWLPVNLLHPGYNADIRNEFLPDEHLLCPAALPPMLYEARRVGSVRSITAPPLSETHSTPIRSADHLGSEEPAWMDLLHGKAHLTIPAHTRRRVLLDLGNYYCAYPEVMVSGGEDAILRLHWQEGLFEKMDPWDRGNRGQVEGKYFTTMWWDKDGIGDRYRLDGGQHRYLDSLWWHAGRFVEILVETSNAPLTIESLTFFETRYPLERESEFKASDARLEGVIPIAVRGLQMCAHETYMDCPYYEQLMYVGDTRLECLVTYAITHDDRLPRKALQMFNRSRLPSGLTQSRYPSRIRQMIPPFSLWWVGMIYDHLLWRGNLEFVRNLLPGMRGVLDAFITLRGEDGLVRSPQYWNYIDWVPEWPGGEPPGSHVGKVCGPLNWQVVYAVQKAAEVEAAVGEGELAVRFKRISHEMITSLTKRYWCPEKGLYADDADHKIFTEHSQCLAVLSAGLPYDRREAIAQNLFTAPGLTPPTVYFMHYYFEACRELGRMDQFFKRMNYWYEMQELDFKTTYENADPHTNRSDCHAWGAHPLYHYFASVLGIRPVSPAFEKVEIRPQLGDLIHASGTMVHPRGEIGIEVHQVNGGLHGWVDLPEGVTGSICINGQVVELGKRTGF